MAKEDKPLEYQRRLRDTKGVAQRLDLDYLKRTAPLGLLRRRLTWALVAAAVLACVPLVMGVGGSRGAAAAGPLSEPHALYEKRCEVCHTRAFGGVPDQACQQCHDGAAHPAKLVDTAHSTTRVRCAGCHAEHRGRQRLSAVADVNCTACHAQISAHAAGAKVRNVTAFAADRHPEFAATSQRDLRPLRLNHAVHMPAAARSLRGITLPMQCADCHVTDRTSASGAMLPVTFEQNCKSCHARELEFDVYHLLGPAAAPAPHTKDAGSIREYVAGAYRQAVAANPGLAKRPLGTELAPAASAALWLERVTRDSERYLFARKCIYCHETAGDHVVRNVNPVAGRFVEGNPRGVPWLERGEFAHRSHRASACEDCHTQARVSTGTADVLIPGMKSCLPCHGESGSALDRCATCHLYHNRSLEKAPSPHHEKEVRP